MQPFIFIYLSGRQVPTFFLLFKTFLLSGKIPTFEEYGTIPLTIIFVFQEKATKCCHVKQNFVDKCPKFLASLRSPLSNIIVVPTYL